MPNPVVGLVVIGVLGVAAMIAVALFAGAGPRAHTYGGARPPPPPEFPQVTPAAPASNSGGTVRRRRKRAAPAASPLSSVSSDDENSIDDTWDFLRSPSGVRHGSSASSSDDAAQRLLCVACSVEDRGVALQPCGHVCLCQSCTAKIIAADNVCPLCRTPIGSTFNVYL